MLGRFYIHIPFRLYMQSDLVLRSLEMEREGYSVRIHPLQQSQITPSEINVIDCLSFTDAIEKLKPAAPPVISDRMLIDKKSAINLNMMVIDFKKDDFDRRQCVPHVQADPPIALVFSIANNILINLRMLARGHEIKAISDRSTFWRVEYRSDDEQKLPRIDGLFRNAFGGAFKGTLAALTPTLWNRLCELPDDFVAQTWDALLLDAEALLPDAGPAIAVANAALETFILWVLNHLQETTKFTNQSCGNNNLHL